MMTTGFLPPPPPPKIEWHDGYPPSPTKQGPFRRWVARKMERRAVCPVHKRWEPVLRWRGCDLPEDVRGPAFHWAQQVEAVTSTGCVAIYTIDPINGFKSRPDLVEE